MSTGDDYTPPPPDNSDDYTPPPPDNSDDYTPPPPDNSGVNTTDYYPPPSPYNSGVNTTDYGTPPSPYNSGLNITDYYTHPSPYNSFDDGRRAADIRLYLIISSVIILVFIVGLAFYCRRRNRNRIRRAQLSETGEIKIGIVQTPPLSHQYGIQKAFAPPAPTTTIAKYQA